MPARSVGRSSSPSPSRQGLLSRIRSPFGKKSGKKHEFYIQPDDPHRQYSPGDVVTGSVVLKVVRPIDITHIVVCLHGFAQVYRSPNNPGEGYRAYNAALIAGKTNKAGGYYGNGFASLFEDEITLCGDGRLGEGTYQFNFELHFPREHAPTSIDFERGTITYMITSTVTRPYRPTIMNQTLVCERRVAFVDNIDIAPLLTPKPRDITLEPLPRRARTRARRKEALPEDRHSGHINGGVSDPGASRPAESVSANGDADAPRSPASERSFESSERSGGPHSVGDSVTQSCKTTESRFRATSSPRASVIRRPINASVAITRAGHLRGDTVDIRIHISHNKQIKSLHGVIVTLFRQARVDMHPALPVVTGKGDDDIFPKSRTGLGGLSLSAAGSCHVFRKDLDQNWASIIINPDTLTQDIKTSVRIPEDAFPTVSTVPGAMISFKYHVEIILDLQGKLAGLDRYFGGAVPGSSSGPRSNNPLGTPGAHGPWGSHIVNTEEIRREKNVVHCNFEIVVGTKDSERNGTWRQPPLPPTTILEDVLEGSVRTPEGNEDPTPYESLAGRSRAYSESGSSQPLRTTDIKDHVHQEVPRYEEAPPPPLPHDPISIPLPNIPLDEAVSEKERLRRAEERLLPSQPFEAIGEPSSSHLPHAPSAPALPDLQPLALSNHTPSNGFSFNPPSSSGATAPPFLSAESSNASAPAYESHASSSRLPPLPTDDKQELERRRLHDQRSAPPEATPDTAGAEAGPSAPPMESAPVTDFTPSAPRLNDEDTFGFNTPEPAQALPRYER